MSTRTTQDLEERMKLLPSGVPVNDDTWMKLSSWIEKNFEETETWLTHPPTIEEEERIYNIFGCTTVPYKDFYKVYVVSSGCIYEGGGVDGVFIRKDLAEAKFNEMVEEKREDMRAMEAYEKECIESGKHRSFRADGYWLQEKDESTDTDKCIIFKSDYIALREWECEV